MALTDFFFSHTNDTAFRVVFFEIFRLEHWAQQCQQTQRCDECGAHIPNGEQLKRTKRTRFFCSCSPTHTPPPSSYAAPPNHSPPHFTTTFSVFSSPLPSTRYTAGSSSLHASRGERLRIAAAAKDASSARNVCCRQIASISIVIRADSIWHLVENRG